MAKWYPTKFKGIRYRKHESRKHGALLDKYFTIRFQAEGKRHEEGLGWASNGWSEQKAALELERLKQNYKKGEGPVRLKEKRKLAQDQRDKRERHRLTFDRIFKRYLEWAKGNKKHWKADDYNYNYFLKPFLGGKLLTELTPYYLEKVKSKLNAKGYAPATVKHCLVLVRQVFNKAIAWDMWEGDNPIKKVKLPKLDNKKERVLTSDDETELMSRLRIKSKATWAMAMTSLYAGLRYGEIAQLRWQQINFQDKKITVHGKGGKTRTVPMNQTMIDIYRELKPSHAKNNDFIFPSKKGGVRKQASSAYFKTVQELGLNKDITDNRYRINFHTLRHTFATRLATAGTPLHVLRDLLGHSDLTMLSRYAHLIPSQADQVVGALDDYQK